jgi:superfamily II DNA or RNA helicase
VLVDAASDPLQVYKCVDDNGHIYLGVIHPESRLAQELLFTRAEFSERVRIMVSQRYGACHSRTCCTRDQFELAIEALRLQSAHLLDPFHAINASQIDLLPHQADAVYRHILPQARIRYLLADDPGLGKTIMAGLVLKELQARGVVNRCLIVVPAHLQEQWQRELSDWFREDVAVLDKGTLSNAKHAMYFEKHPIVITSMDFAKRDPARSVLAGQQWDLLIVDEAHKLSAKQSGRNVDKSKRYQLAEALGPQSRHILFLTATPHNGNDSSYHLLLNLLEPRLFSTPGQLRQASRTEHGVPFVLRRSKDRVTDLSGNRLFPTRSVETLTLTMTPQERAVYDEVTEYVRQWYPYTPDLSWLSERRRRNIALALTVLQRRVTSGMTAIRHSLNRRRSKLQGLVSAWESWMAVETGLLALDADETVAELDDQQAGEWDRLQERIEGVSAAVTLEELHMEIQHLDDLVKLVQRVEASGQESKLQQIQQVIEQHLVSNPDEKLLIFSEFKDTVLFLNDYLEDAGLSVAMIHGGMDMSERRRQEQRFRDQAQVMVATDAAAEGINLQFCRLMINYDLPWNPNRLEQRMGRIHRYGQTRDCFVWNLLYEDTREGDILSRLFQKIERMKARPELGDTIYDVISAVLAGVSLERQMMDAIVDDDTTEIDLYIEHDLEDRVEEFMRLLKDNALAARHIDLSEVRESLQQSLDEAVTSQDVERFTRQAVNRLGGGLVKDTTHGQGVFRLGIPESLRDGFKAVGYESGLRIAFDRAVARDRGVAFFAPGHPILDRLIDSVRPGSPEPPRAVLRDPEWRSGTLWVYRIAVVDGDNEKVVDRVCALFRCAHSGRIVPRDLRAISALPAGPPLDLVPEALMQRIEVDEMAARREAVRQIEPQRLSARDQREHEAGIRREWLTASFTALLREADEKIDAYRLRLARGERIIAGPLAIEEQHRAALVREWDERLEQLQRGTQLTVLAPELQALAIVIGTAAAPASGRNLADHELSADPA